MIGNDGVLRYLLDLLSSLINILMHCWSTDFTQALYLLPAFKKSRILEAKSSGSRPIFWESVETTATICSLATIVNASPGCRQEVILGSPRRVRLTVLVMPGSSKNIGGGADGV